MRLQAVGISNIRGLGVGEPLSLDLCPGGRSTPRWISIVGPNGAGKSTLLRAIALACSGQTVCRPLQPAPGWWLSRSADDEAPPARAEVVACIEPDADDAWSLAFPGRASVEAIDLRIRIDDEKYVAFEPPAELLAPPIRMPSLAAGPWNETDRRAGWFIAGYGAHRRLGRGSRDSERMRGEFPQPTARLVSLFREDVALVEPLEWLESLEFQALKGRGDARDAALRLRPQILGLLSDGLLGRSAKVIDIAPEGLIIREDGLSLPLTELSDGYQAVTGLILDLIHQLHRGPGGVKIAHDPSSLRYVVHNSGIVLIDELERHLHPAWQRRIGRWLVERFPRMQFIVATHSAFIAQTAAHEGVIVRLARVDEPTGSRVLDDDELGHVLNGTADDIYLSGLFGVASVRSEQAQADLERATVLEGRIRRGRATTEEKDEYRELIGTMPASSEIIRALGAVGRST